MSDYHETVARNWRRSSRRTNHPDAVGHAQDAINGIASIWLTPDEIDHWGSAAVADDRGRGVRDRRAGLDRIDDQEGDAVDTVTANLLASLHAWLDEIEQAARAVASPPPWEIDVDENDYGQRQRAIRGHARGATVAYDPVGGEESERDFAHIVHHDPARVLADVAAKRQIIELHRPANPGRGAAIQDGRTSRGCSARRAGSGEPNEYPTDWPCATFELAAQLCIPRAPEVEADHG